jgi:hypothetical protein
MIANILFTRSGDINDPKAKSYLVASFVEGDREHWGRFLRAAHAYATGEYSESKRLFEDLDRRAPQSFRPQLGRDYEWLTQALRDRQGRVAKSFGSFFLITPEIGPDGLYAPERASDAEIWETLGVRSAVRFDVDFGRRGPIARDVHPVR